MNHRHADWHRITTNQGDCWMFGTHNNYVYRPSPIWITPPKPRPTGSLPGFAVRNETHVYRTRSARVFTARIDAYCPFCSNFIRANKSQIVRIEEPTPPIAFQDQPYDGFFSAITGRAFNLRATPIGMFDRDYAHYDCVKYMMRTFWHPECTYCGNPDELSIDHIRPVSELGADEPGNITVACKRCNSRKGTKHVNDFLAKLDA